MLVKMGLMKRAKNVNEDFPFAATIPAGTTCSGTVAGQSNVCLVKIVNPSGAGPFGGVVAIQMAGTGVGASNSTVATTAAEDASSGSAAGTSTDSKGKATKPKIASAKFRLG
jgi:Egh16-like virulence factor